MARARAELARQILRHAPHEEIQEEAMNFFETLGMLLRRGYLDREMVWGDFSFHAVRWWHACSEYVRDERSRKGNDATLFEDFEHLAADLSVMDQAKLARSRGEVKPSAEAIREFLQEEAALAKGSPTNDRIVQ